VTSQEEGEVANKWRSVGSAAKKGQLVGVGQQKTKHPQGRNNPQGMGEIVPVREEDQIKGRDDCPNGGGEFPQETPVTVRVEFRYIPIGKWKNQKRKNYTVRDKEPIQTQPGRGVTKRGRRR